MVSDSVADDFLALGKKQNAQANPRAAFKCISAQTPDAQAGRHVRVAEGFRQRAQGRLHFRALRRGQLARVTLKTAALREADPSLPVKGLRRRCLRS